MTLDLLGHWDMSPQHSPSGTGGLLPSEQTSVVQTMSSQSTQQNYLLVHDVYKRIHSHKIFYPYNIFYIEIAFFK